MTLSSYYANKEESQRGRNRKLQKLEESNIRVTDWDICQTTDQPSS